MAAVFRLAILGRFTGTECMLYDNLCVRELYPVLQLAKTFPNISGIYLDDFIVDTKKQPDGTVVGRPALRPAELKRAREQRRFTPAALVRQATGTTSHP